MIETKNYNILSKYLQENPDWADYVDRGSDDAVSMIHNSWLKNAKCNVHRIRLSKRDAIAENVGCAKDKFSIIIGAAPSIQKNCDDLFYATNDNNFILICVNSVLKFLLLKGIEPDFVVVCDASPELKKHFKGIGKLKKTKMIAAHCVHPSVLSLWENDVSYVRMQINEERDPEHIKLYPWLTFIHASGNAFNFGARLAYSVFGSKTLIFCGNDLSFEEKYYVDGDSFHDGEEKFAAPDIQGKKVNTLPELYQYKLWLEDFCAKMPGNFINASEAGILGMTKRYGRLSFIKQMRLKTIIEKCKEAKLLKDSLIEKKQVDAYTFQGLRSYA